MEAKLVTAEKECFCKIFSIEQRKEESRDAVVPDTQPDISEVLLSGGKVLIRSKDVVQGRVRIEAALAAQVLYKGEDGKIWTVEINTPFFFSLEDERIGENAEAIAKLALINLDAKALNPRKINLRTELCCEISIYEKDKIYYTECVDEGDKIKSHCNNAEISIIGCVGEKTFSLADEIAIPGDAKAVKDVLSLGIEGVVDEVKSVGSKIILKGRVKNHLTIIDSEQRVYYLEPQTDFSQIIELKKEIDLGSCCIHLTPSGAYCALSGEQEGKIGLEYHVVTQFVCGEDIKIEYVDDVYSNTYKLEKAGKSIAFERNRENTPMRDTFRHLYESPFAIKDIVCSHVRLGKAAYEPGKIVIPYYLVAICLGDNGIFSEKHRGDISFNIGRELGSYSLKSFEIKSWSALSVPGGLEVRMETEAHIIENDKIEIAFVEKLEYDEESIIDTSPLPSLVLLRLGEGEELWDIARENCSSVEAIMEVNEITAVEDKIGKLIIIPKTN
ncbi:MAG: DUF3794 domain-containing protein [Oscillospiraceae bacterium]|nr:DUF3794 domain-containing protein [Oscillospiraceae bacterium]